MAKPAQRGLRDLAHKISELTRKHPAYSQALPAVANLCDHLSAMAGNEEKNRQIVTLEKLIAIAPKKR